MNAITPEAKPGILFVDDDVSAIHVLGKALECMGSLHFAKGGHEALRVARSDAIAVLLRDAELPVTSGFQVSEALKSNPDLARAATQIRHKRAAAELRELTLSDSLTGLANRRAFDAALAREWGRSHCSSEPLSVMLVDVDHFKSYNAHHGRRRGDECLVSVAQALVSSVKRPADLAARYGGGLFAVMLPFTDRAGALEVGRRILRQVTSHCIAHGAPGAGAAVTVSIGVSSFDEECDNWVSDGRSTRQTEPVSVCATDLVEAASLALAQTKQSGRADEAFVSIYRAVAERMADQPLA